MKPIFLSRHFKPLFNNRLKNGLKAKPGRRRTLEAGFTAVELLIVIAIMGILVPSLLLLFTKSSQGFAADEMHNSLKKANEQTLLRLHLRLESMKHMMQNDAGSSGVSYLNALQLNPASNAPPAVLAGSQLPVSQNGATITFSPNAGAQASQFGNELLFGAFDGPTTVFKPFATPGTAAANAYTAPITVVGNASWPVTYSGGQPATFILDVYRFYYYYLTASRRPIYGFPTYGLVEWRSVQYVDYNELNALKGDITLQNCVLNWLSAGNTATGTGYNVPGYPIFNAWDPSRNVPFDPSGPYYGFYTIGAGPSLAPSTTSPYIFQSDWTYLTQVPIGILSSGFAYGISSNSNGYGGAPSVPKYATASGAFPGGFEVGITGTGAGMQVMIRSLLVAKGNAPRVVYNDSTVINNARDVW